MHLAGHPACNAVTLFVELDQLVLDVGQYTVVDSGWQVAFHRDPDLFDCSGSRVHTNLDGLVFVLSQGTRDILQLVGFRRNVGRRQVLQSAVTENNVTRVPNIWRLLPAGWFERRDGQPYHPSREQDAEAAVVVIDGRLLGASVLVDCVSQ